MNKNAIVLALPFCWLVVSAHAEEIRFTTAKAGRVSLAVYDGDGGVVRSLLIGKPVEAGEHSVGWDGKDEQGKPVPAGRYEFRGLVATISGEVDGIVANTADRWGGFTEAMDYTGVVCEPDGSFYLLSCGGEFGERIQKYHADGTLAWDPPRGSMGVFPWLFGIDTDGQHVYLQRLNGQQMSVVRLDAKTGKPVPYGDPNKRPPAAVIHKFENFRPPQPYSGPNIPSSPGDMRKYERLPARGLAVHDGLLYLPVTSEDRIIVARADTGEVVRDIKDVPQPQGITDAPDGTLLVSSTTNVLRIDPRTGKRKTVIGGLSNPHGLTLDAHGNIYVADRGDSQQIKKFSPTGKLQMTIGHKGGRLWGRVDPSWLCAPSDVAVDRDGNIYITEQHISRLQKFAPDGKFRAQWYSHYCESPAVDPRDPRWIYISGLGQVRGYKADFKRRTHEWKYSWFRAGWHVGEMMPTFMTGFSGVRYLKGKRFLFNSMPPDLYVLRFVDGDEPGTGEDAGRDLFMAGQIGIRFHNLPGDDPWNHKGNHPAGAQIPGIWTDANGDGVAQTAEISLVDPKDAARDSIPRGSNKRGGAGDFHVDRGGNIYLSAHDRLMRLPLESFNELGNPVYDYAKIEVVWTSPDQEQPETSFLDEADNIYLITADYDNNFAKNKNPGRSVWPQRHKSYSLRKLSPEGRQIWRVGRKAVAERQRGEFYYPSCIAGVHKGLIYVLDVDGTFLVYNEDGLYVGEFGVADGENWCGCIFETEGQLYAYQNSHAWHLTRRFRVNGTGDVQSFRGMVSLIGGQ